MVSSGTTFLWEDAWLPNAVSIPVYQAHGSEKAVGGQCFNSKHFPCWVVYCTRNAKSVVACPWNRLVCPNWTSRTGGLVGGSHFFAVCATRTLVAGQQRRCSFCGTPGSSRTVCTSQRCSCTFGRTPFPSRAKLAHLRSICSSLHAPCALGTKLTCSRIRGANLLIEATHRAGNTHCLRVQVSSIESYYAWKMTCGNMHSSTVRSCHYSTKPVFYIQL